MSDKKYMLFDIDGCCLNPEKRIHHLLNGDPEKYESLWHLDEPIAAGISVYKSLMDSGVAIPVFNTARREAQRASTTYQLNMLFPEHAGKYELWMRPDNTSSTAYPAWKLKTEQLFKFRSIKPSDVLIAFDDENKVIKAYRAAGIVAYQTDSYDEDEV